MDSPDLEVRLLRTGEEEAACGLVSQVFREFVAPLFPPEGAEEFLSFVTVEALTQRRAEGNLLLAGWQGPDLVAFLEMRAGPHLALFFVSSDLQRTGRGRRLLAHALEQWRESREEPRRLTVNASPNAVDAYRRLGFRATNGMQTKNGISFVPMALAIESGIGHT